MNRVKKIYDSAFEKFEWLLSFLLRINKVHVDREKYVRKTVRRFCRDNEQEMFHQAMETSLADVLSEKQQKKAYRRIVSSHAWVVFLVSFVTCFPESIWGIVIACVIDFVLFQIALYHAMQLILILYGKSCDLTKQEDEGVEMIIAIESSGLMMGKYPLMQRMKSVVGWLLRQVVKRFGPRLAAKASRAAFVVLRRQAIKWISVVAAKQHINLVFDALIPITCSIIAGLVSVVILVPMCNKLRNHLLNEER